MAHVGTEALGYDDTMNGLSVTEQWHDISAKLRSLDSSSPSEKYEGELETFRRKHRNDSVHNFVYDIDKNDIDSLREMAEGWRSWLIDQAEKYNSLFGTYSKAEYEDFETLMHDPLLAHAYQYAAVALEREIEHAARNLLKSEGIPPTSTGRLHNAVGKASRSGLLEDEHAELYSDLHDLSKDMRDGQIQHVASDDMRDVEEAWEASEDASHQTPAEAYDTVDNSMELLEYIHNKQNPFKSSAD